MAGCAKPPFAECWLVDHAERTLFLMRGKDLSGENDFRLRW